MIFTVDRNTISYVITEGANIVSSFTAERDKFTTFLNKFNISIDNVIHLSYEPDRNIYHVTKLDGVFAAYEKAEGDEVMSFIKENEDAIYWWFYDETEMRNPVKFHTYDSVAHEWTITPENALLLKAETHRKQRNSYLSKSDWTQLIDAPGDRDAWAAYRQALRDIPQQRSFPNDVSWPVPPS